MPRSGRYWPLRLGRSSPTFLTVLFHTATRSEETRAMKWSGVDFELGIWTIPPEAAKTGGLTGEAHLVPLSRGALADWWSTQLKRLLETRDDKPKAAKPHAAR
jgi:integrase